VRHQPLLLPFHVTPSLSANQFILSAGKYIIEASAPGYGAIGFHKVRVYNTTNATTVLVGSNSRLIAGVFGNSNATGEITITSTKTFKVEHRFSIANAEGLGIANSFGEVEIYTQVKITKLD